MRPDSLRGTAQAGTDGRGVVSYFVRMSLPLRVTWRRYRSVACSIQMRGAPASSSRVDTTRSGTGEAGGGRDGLFDCSSDTAGIETSNKNASHLRPKNKTAPTTLQARFLSKG